MMCPGNNWARDLLIATAIIVYLTSTDLFVPYTLSIRQSDFVNRSSRIDLILNTIDVIILQLIFIVYTTCC